MTMLVLSIKRVIWEEQILERQSNWKKNLSRYMNKHNEIKENWYMILLHYRKLTDQLLFLMG